MMQPQHKIKILLIDDHPLVLDGIRACLEQSKSVTVSGTANDGEQALALAAKIQPDVALMDISMPGMNGFALAEAFSHQLPEIKVLIFTMHDDRDYIVRMAQHNIAGYILKDATSDELLTAIEKVYNGGSYFSSGVAHKLLSQMVDSHSLRMFPDESLSEREQEVLKLLAAGQSNKKIARALCLSVRTIESHRFNIKKKLDIKSSAGLIRYAIDKGIE